MYQMAAYHDLINVLQWLRQQQPEIPLPDKFDEQYSDAMVLYLGRINAHLDHHDLPRLQVLRLRRASIVVLLWRWLPESVTREVACVIADHYFNLHLQ